MPDRNHYRNRYRYRYRYRYQDIYPSTPTLDSNALARPSAAELLTLEYFEAEPGSMPTRTFSQHHILLNLKAEPHRVENWRNGEHRDFTFHQNEIVVTPAGVESGWRWHETSDVIVITLEPEQLLRFAQSEVGVLLGESQLLDLPQFEDADICSAGVMLRDALASPEIGNDVMFEYLSRVFLVKLIQRYGERPDEHDDLAKGFTSKRFRSVLHHVAGHFAESITVEDLADAARLSASHFSRVFKATIGQSPMQFVSSYRIEQAKKMLANPDRPLTDIAVGCGFADQAHFSRVFKQLEDTTPRAYRDSLTR